MGTSPKGAIRSGQELWDRREVFHDLRRTIQDTGIDREMVSRARVRSAAFDLARNRWTVRRRSAEEP